MERFRRFASGYQWYPIGNWIILYFLSGQIQNRKILWKGCWIWTRQLDRHLIKRTCELIFIIHFLLYHQISNTFLAESVTTHGEEPWRIEVCELNFAFWTNSLFFGEHNLFYFYFKKRIGEHKPNNTKIKKGWIISIKC